MRIVVFRVVVNQHDMSSSLIFIEPSADHSGQYECKAAVSGEERSKAVNVTFLRTSPRRFQPGMTKHFRLHRIHQASDGSASGGGHGSGD